MKNRKRGFTLIEIVVVIVVIAVLVAILVPTVEKNVLDAKIARARSDVQTIAKGMIQCRTDLLKWSIENSTGDAVDYLVGTKPDVDLNKVASPWAGGITSSETIYYELIDAGNHYTKIDPNPHNFPAWNGPYINDTRLDPWGWAYVINVAHLEGGTSPDTTKHAWVISAGPDGVFQTDSNGTGDISGDDVGYAIQ